MTADKILNYCLSELEGTVLVNNWGERGIFYNPCNKLKRGIYVLTIKEKDGENDSSSKLDRENIYRVNLVSFFGERYETISWMQFSVEDYDGLQMERTND